MLGNTIVILIATAILAAALLDFLLLLRTRRYLKDHGLSEPDRSQGVYILGSYSPLLTWLRYRRLPGWQDELPPDGAASQDMEEPQAVESDEIAPVNESSRSKVNLRWTLLEIGLMILAVTLYCSAILDLDQSTRLPGNESDVFQTLDWTLVNSLRQSGRFPLWNPYLNTGQPYVADPMLHALNPISTLPVLLFGVRAGFKLGIYFSFMLAALGMWWLASVLGMSRPTRLWVALMFAFAGQPVARFFQGQYLFVLGFAWIPWTVGSLFMLAKTGRRTYWATSALALALLFFSGNVYYAFYMLILVAFFALVYGVSVHSVKPFVSIDRKLAISLLVTGALALGVIAVQLLPMAEFWPRLSKSLEVAGSHTLQQIYLDYTSKDTYRPDAYSVLPAREEFYAYIGRLPILAMLLIPAAVRRGKRKPLLVFALLLIFVVLWIGMVHMPWYQAFLNAKTLLQFRHLLRILIYGSFAILVLGGLGIDSTWRLFAEQASQKKTGLPGQVRQLSANLGLVILGALMLVSVGDVYQTNRKHIRTEPVNQAVYNAMGWLRRHDLADYYVRLNPNNAVQDAVISAGLRFIEAWYHFGDIRNLAGSVNARPIQARPHYIVQSPGSPPDSPGAELIRQQDGYDIFHLPASLPYVFSVNSEQLSPSSNPAPLASDEVVTQTSFTPGPNGIEVIASAGEGEMLVVLTTHYPGWAVRVDDRPHPLENVGGYLGTQLLPGVHKYTFSFRPRSFTLGLALSLVCTLVALTLLVSDTRPAWRSAYARLRATPGRARQAWQTVKDKVSASPVFIEAIYRDGILHPQAPPGLDEDARVRLAIEPADAVLSPGRQAWRRWNWASAALIGLLVRSIPLAALLSFGALVVYAISRYYALERFPIYFFGDEAVQVLFAQNLITRQFHSPDGTLLPIYVEAAGNRWTPLLSMYFHAASLTLFGKSILVSRLTSAVVSLLGAGAVGLMMHKAFKSRFPWVGVMLVAIAPAWFLHSRTAFETVMTTAFYACFLLCYMLYRNESPRYLYAAVIFGAMTFYSYSNAQAIILAAAGLLFLSDLRYHWSNRQVVLKALALAVLLAIPFIEFRLNYPEAITEHLRTVGSYWYQSGPLSQKLLTFAGKYLYGLSPQYWFFPNAHDLPRHRMLGFGHIHTLLLPLVLLGLAVCIANWRSSQHRAVVLAALATPVGAALVDVGIARVLAFIIPANLMAAIGLDWLLERWKERLPYKAVAWILFVVLAWAQFALLRTSLVDGPLWFRDYGLYGMQYGARQLFEEAIPQYLEADAETQILVSSTWANGADNFLRFFLTSEEQKRVRMGGVESFLFRKLPLDDRMLFVMTAAEYQRASQSAKFGAVKLDQMLPYPDGTPGFYFAHLEYAKTVDDIFAAEQEARKQLLVASAVMDGETVDLHYSQTDMGAPALMFDGDPFTLMRGTEANPFILELYFQEPRSVSGLTADFGLVNVTLTAKLYAQDEGEPVTVSQTYLNANSGNPAVELLFPNAPEQVAKLRLEILNVLSGEIANIHIRELHLLP